MKRLYKTCLAFLAIGQGCGIDEKLQCEISDIECQAKLPTPSTDKNEQYEVCKSTDSDGNTHDNCVDALQDNGECSENRLKVKSDKRASEYECLMDL